MYHVNPETGKFDICHAESPENCPFEIENHSDNLEDIQIKADKINKNKFKIPTEKELNNIIITETEFAKIDGLGTKFNECEFNNVTLQDNVSFYRGQFNQCEFSDFHDDYGKFGPHFWTLNKFTEATFNKSKFKNILLNCPVFSGTKINNCEFDNSTIKQGFFRDSYLNNVKFNNSSKLYKPDLDYTNWDNVDFDKTSELIQKKG